MSTISVRALADGDAKLLRLGPYVLSEPLGRAGMANLYRAVHTGPNGFEKTVVVAAMLPALVENRELVDRFSAAARTTAQLNHPAIVQVYDYGVDQEIPYVVTEHLDGINLSQLIGAMTASGRRLPLGVALVIATEMCQALGFAHTWRDPQGVRRPIIHSDVSPENVMICRDGSVKLLGFGGSRAEGKFAYLAPEQANRLPFDCRVDVFGAGVVLHEMLTGRRLFGGPSDLETLRRVDATEVTPPSFHNLEVPRALDLVTRKALSRDPDERFTDGESMAAALQQLEHIGSGRRRVAELIASLFPECWQVHCDVCRKPLVPVLMCVQCGADAPAGEIALPDEGRAVTVAPPILPVDVAREAAPGLDSPSPSPPPPSHASVAGSVPAAQARTSGLGYRALLGGAIVATLLAVGADIRERHRSAAEQQRVARQPVSQVAPVSSVSPVSPASPAPAQPIAPATLQLLPPLPPSTPPSPDVIEPPVAHTHAARTSTQRHKPAAHVATIASPPPVAAQPDEAPRIGDPATPNSIGSADPRLLDPFGSAK